MLAFFENFIKVAHCAVIKNASKFAAIKDELDSSTWIVYPEFHSFQREVTPHGETPFSILILTSENATYYVELQENRDLNDISVHLDDNQTSRFPEKSGCHFYGKIINHPSGSVAISTCEGKMTGMVMIDDKVYLLKPSPNQNKGGKGNEHFLQEYHGENQGLCGISKSKSFELEAKGLIKLRESNVNTRYKRVPVPPKRKIIELAIFVDSKFSRRIETTNNVIRVIKRRVTNIMNEVELLFNDSTLKTKFKFTIVKFHILKSTRDGPNPQNGDIVKYLHSFCAWQSKLNSPEGSGSRWDHAIMLTGWDLIQEGNVEVAGLAWVNGMCSRAYSCSLSEGFSDRPSLLIAHEMAHSLGVGHDGKNNCKSDKFIMSEYAGPEKYHWSDCSNADIDKFLKSGKGKCLSDDPASLLKGLDSWPLPGLRYSLQDQCHLAYGAGFTPYKRSTHPFNNVCRQLWCESKDLIQPAYPALEGTPCDAGKRCLKGVCRTSSLPRPSDIRRTP